MNELEERIFAFVLKTTPDELLEKSEPKANENAVAKLKLELSNTNVAIKNTVGRLAKFPDMAELDAMLTELNAKRKSLQEQIVFEETKRAAASARPVTVAKFKDLMRGVDYAAMDDSADSIHFRLQDDKVREELRNIMPDVIKRIICNLSKWEYDVEFINGQRNHFVFDA